ncbi:MarR family winged helix-turn-helix transcriptional regulator [Peribacillus asahii]|uniref:MarR family winged helix-turn-helix transcriptional regulator n=1 Tax=Peribacillus asahii TaxID=228899 RepID=UPI00207A1441|nr:MarR family transcriptional regulator [Peribacillus asahii]USK62157.1 MarR family transcriptional regulator [Peribacillus asahii]
MKAFQKFFHQFTLLYRPFENKLNILLSQHQIQRAQWTILYYLSLNGSITLVELSNYLSVEKPTVTRTINRLEELGYVEQIPSKDKREKRIQLTELGKEVYKHVRITIDQFEMDILKGISEQEQLNAIHIMEEIHNNLIEWEDKN